MRRWTLRLAIAGVAIVVLVQVIPYGRDHTNPPAVAEPQWNSVVTRQLTQTACYDCHSNLTTWPWYSNVAPMSWLVYNDVQGGRENLNFTRWDKPQEPSAQEVAEIVRSGEMPPLQYTLIHRNAKLSSSERAALAAGLATTITRSPPGQ